MSTITHHYTQVNNTRIFYREVGPKGAPVLLLPHGYPCSSFQYRNLMLELAAATYARRQKIMVGLMEGLKQNLAWMPKAQAYLRDLPNAELHLLSGGH